MASVYQIEIAWIQKFILSKSCLVVTLDGILSKRFYQSKDVGLGGFGFS